MSATLDPRRREAARMAELDRLGAMRPGEDRVLQEFVDDAREVFGAEFCMVNLVTADTQFYKVWSGELPPEIAAVRLNPRGRNMCRHVVEDERPFVVEDFFTTERSGEQYPRMGPGVRFYAGTPLKTSEGHAIGSLCLVDSRPREFGDKDRATLRAFAGAVVGRLEALGAAARERDAGESEGRYRRNAFELANDAILIYGTDTGLILDANRRACEIYGFPQEAFVGMNIAGLACERESEEGHTREVLRLGSHRGFETAHRRADGARMHVSINSSVTEYGGERAILSIVREVTGRGRTEESMSQSERSLAQAQRIAHIGNWEHELRDGRTHWSDEMYRIFGFDPRALTPSYKTFMLFVHPDDREHIRGSIRGVLRGNRPEDVEYRIVRPDGDVRFVYTQYEVSYDESGRPAKFSGTVHDVTERKRAEEDLEESRRRLSALLSNAPAYVYRCRNEPGCPNEFVSDYALELTGYTSEELTDGSVMFADLIVEADRDRVWEEVQAGLSERKGFELRYSIRRKGGEVRHVEERGRGLHGEGGVVEAIEGVVYDVTERVRAEERLGEAERRYRTLVEQMPVVTYVQEAAGSEAMTYVSPQMETMLGYTPEECIADPHHWIKILHPDDRERVLAEDRRTGETGEPFSVEYRQFAKDGRVVWVRDAAALVRDERGEPSYWLGVQTDVTERKQAEDALGESEERYRAVVEQSAEAIWMFDPETKRVLETNAAFQEMLGYDAEELRGMTNYDFVAHSREDVDRTVGLKMRGEENSRSERKYRMKDGTLLDVEVGGTVISYRGKEVVCSVARDITERKRVEEEIRETNRRLGELATLRADFTAMVAHELDTPLAVIRGYADVLATGELGHAESRRALAQIQSETEVLNTLVEDVRVAASAERKDFAVRPREVPIEELLAAAARFVVTLPGDHSLDLEHPTEAAEWGGVRAGYADAFTFEGGAGGSEVWADRYRIGQVLRNLLANAVKYSPEGAPIGLRAVPGEVPGRLRIEVADRGPGIHPDDLERVFEKFGRGRSPEGRKVSGVGLGLYLSRRILRAHGSDLTISARPGGGSVFGFELEEVAR